VLSFSGSEMRKIIKKKEVNVENTKKSKQDSSFKIYLVCV